MEQTIHTLKTGLAPLLFVGVLWACGSRNTPPENTPTPLPTPEEQPAGGANPIEGTSQPRDTVRTLPDP